MARITLFLTGGALCRPQQQSLETGRLRPRLLSHRHGAGCGFGGRGVAGRPVRPQGVSVWTICVGDHQREGSVLPLGLLEACPDLFEERLEVCTGVAIRHHVLLSENSYQLLRSHRRVIGTNGGRL